jgi:tRNA (guanine37-N1)-methyltransferase
MLRIDVITIFPELFEPFRKLGVLGGAVDKGLLALEAHDLRRFTQDKHRTVDDIPYGGGPGMVMKPEPLVEAIDEIAGAKGPERNATVILLSPQGAPFSQDVAENWARDEHLVLVCGRYEGIDQRAIELAIDQEISIGDYVVSGGEVPAMAVIEAVSRFVPGVLGNPESAQTDSFQRRPFQERLLEGPQYTRPVDYRGQIVPPVLRSGDHGRIADWRKKQALERTQERRPDLIDRKGQRGED